MTSYTALAVGDALPAAGFPITRATLVAYAGASGDHNPIHWSQRTAQGVGLPDVIAHGMLTMALTGRVLSYWAGHGSVESFGVRFSKPVVIPDDDTGTLLEVAGTVEELLGDGRVAVALTVTVGGSKVLMGAKAVVRLPA